MLPSQPQRPALQHREAKYQGLWLGHRSQQRLQLRGQGLLALIGRRRGHQLLQPGVLLPWCHHIKADVLPGRRVTPLGGQAHQQGPIAEVMAQRAADAAA
jgi:hypothetical protein